jgi:sulfotransferase
MPLSQRTPNKRIIYITGLPRSDSALVSQLLHEYPEGYSPRHRLPRLAAWRSLFIHFLRNKNFRFLFIF